MADGVRTRSRRASGRRWTQGASPPGPRLGAGPARRKGRRRGARLATGTGKAADGPKVDCHLTRTRQAKSGPVGPAEALAAKGPESLTAGSGTTIRAQIRPRPGTGSAAGCEARHGDWESRYCGQCSSGSHGGDGLGRVESRRGKGGRDPRAGATALLLRTQSRAQLGIPSSARYRMGSKAGRAAGRPFHWRGTGGNLKRGAAAANDSDRVEDAAARGSRDPGKGHRSLAQWYEPR